MPNTDPDRINGFRRDDLNLIKRGLEAHSNNRRFNLRAKNRWIDGSQSLSWMSSFYGMGREFSARTAPFIQTTVNPAVLLGKNRGPNPMEEVLVALASSVPPRRLIARLSRIDRSARSSVKLKAISICRR